jgi:hypothetical protein
MAVGRGRACLDFVEAHGMFSWLSLSLSVETGYLPTARSSDWTALMNWMALPIRRTYQTLSPTWF